MRPKILQDDPIRNATILAFKRVADPLLDLMFDTGITVKELTHLLRDRAVRIADKRILNESGRSSKSRVAIITGLPRSEVTKLLSSSDQLVYAPSSQHRARRVLAAWYENPRFLSPSGEPAILRIFGKRRTFEQLVSSHGGGIPVRAMLDELTQLNAIEIDSDQRVRAKSRVPITVGLTPAAVAGLGEQCAHLLETLTRNLKNSKSPLFEATVLISDADLEMLPIARREVAVQASSFMQAVNGFLKRSRKKPLPSRSNEATPSRRIGVTTFYFEEDGPELDHKSEGSKQDTRRNLQRRPRLKKNTTATRSTARQKSK